MNKINRRGSFIIVLLFLITIGIGLWQYQRQRGFTPTRIIQGQIMGTSYKLVYLLKHNDPLKDRSFSHPYHPQNVVSQSLNLINTLMSTYLPLSEITQINKNVTLEGRPLGFDPTLPRKVSEHFCRIFTEARRLWRKSPGYDVTIMPLVQIWGFGGQNAEKKVPAEKELESLRPYLGMDKVGMQVTPNENDDGLYECFIQKHHPKVEFDFASLAKGYAVDFVSENLINAGYQNFLMEVGGEIRIRGTKGLKPWTVGIETPTYNSRGVQQILWFENDIAFATSGSYRNFFESGGEIYAHTLDIQTLKPTKSQFISASIFHPYSVMTADAIATAVMTFQDLKEAISFLQSENVMFYLMWQRDHSQFASLKDYYQIFSNNDRKDLVIEFSQFDRGIVILYSAELKKYFASSG